MRITIEPTTKEQMSGKLNQDIQYPKVIVEWPRDHMNIWEWIEMFKVILRAVGFLESQVDALRIGRNEDE